MFNRTILSSAIDGLLDKSVFIDRGMTDAVNRGMRRVEKIQRAEIIARPMRNLFDQLASGEAYEADGRIIMSMPDLDAQFAEQANWADVAYAMSGWIDCWQRIDPSISTYYMRVLAARLDDGKDITPRLVEQARAEFDATVARIMDVPDGVISSAITTTQIAWEIEKLTEGAAA